MQVANDIAQLNGVYKKRYAASVSYVMPDGTILIREFRFSESEGFGEDWNEPVSLTYENGFTLVPPNSTGSPAINPARAQTTKNANVNSPQLYLQSELNYEAASRAMKKGEKAIVRALDHVVRMNTESHRTMQEIQAFHGQVDLGVVESAVIADGGSITVTKATWAPGNWAGREGLLIDVLDATLAAQIVGDLDIKSIDFETRTITFKTVAEGGVAVPAGVVAGTRLFVKDAVVAGAPPTWAEPLGVHAALTQAGSVYGIDKSLYTLWTPGAVDALGGPLDFDHSTEAVARVAEKGGTGLLDQFVNPHSFNDLIGDQAALRRYDEEGSTSQYRTGARAIRFYTGNGEVSVRPSIYVKRGFSYVVNKRRWSRKGSQDFSFSSPFSTEAFHVFEQAGGAFARSFSSLTPFCRALGQNALISGIVDSTPT